MELPLAPSETRPPVQPVIFLFQPGDGCQAGTTELKHGKWLTDSKLHI